MTQNPLTRDPLDIPIILGAVVLIIGTEQLLVPKYGWWWFAIVAAYVIAGLFFGWHMRKTSAVQVSGASPTIEGLSGGALFTLATALATLGAQTSARLFGNPWAIVLGAVVGIIAWIVLMVVLVSLATADGRGKQMSPRRWVFLFLYLGTIASTLFSLWLVVR